MFILQKKISLALDFLSELDNVLPKHEKHWLFICKCYAVCIGVPPPSIREGVLAQCSVMRL